LIIAGQSAPLVWNIAGHKVERKLPARVGGIFQLAASPDGKLVAAAGQIPSFRVWNVETGEVVVEPPGHINVTAGTAFSPDGKTIASVAGWASGCDGTVRLWSLSGRELITPDRRGILRDLAVSSDGTSIISAMEPGALEVWDVSTRRLRSRLELAPDRVHSISVGSDRLIALTGYLSGKRKVKLWDVDRTQPGPTLPYEEVTAAGFSPDAETLAVAQKDAGIVLRKVETAEDRTIASPFKAEIVHLIYTSDGKKIVLLDATGDVAAVDPENGDSKMIRKTGSGIRSLQYFALSPDDTLIAGVPKFPQENPVEVIDVSNGRVRYELPRATAVTFSPDGRQIAGVYGDDVWVSELRSGAITREFRFGTGAAIARMNFAPDCRHVVCGHGNGTISVLRFNP
jgi:WD40 repeat protein